MNSTVENTNKKFTIDPNEMDIRDPYMVMIITGVTKSGVHKDRKKHNNKMNCRRKCDRHTED